MDRDNFEDGKWYKLKDSCGGGYRCRFYKGSELVRQCIGGYFKYYEVSNFFLVNPKGYIGTIADTGRKVFDINHIHSVCSYNDNWIHCLEEEN